MIFGDNLCAIVNEDQELLSAIEHINNVTNRAKYGSFTIIVDKNNCYVDVITDGDIRRASIKGFKSNQAVKDIISRKSVYLYEHEYLNKNASDLLNAKMKDINKYPKLIPVLDSNLRVIDLLDLESNPLMMSVAIYGLGFVGITLAGVLASKGLSVIGVEANKKILKNLKTNKCHVDEPGLNELLDQCLRSSKLSYSHSAEILSADIHIVSVGTPINEDGNVNDDALRSVISTIGKILRKDDMVMLRSTVPMGTTRSIVGMLEDLSSLKAGIDFNIAFAPERTIEGNAINELNTLPQIIGGLTKNCEERADEFWQKISPITVRCESLEAAEIVKLANNSFRDLSFAFANQITNLCEEINCDAFEVISNSNTGYPRNKIPFPSPGVGGYCLTKDPLLLERSFKNSKSPGLQRIGRKINKEAALLPLKKLRLFSKKVEIDLSDIRTLIIGIAFKGVPSTNDFRGSSSLDLISELRNYNIKLDVWDAVIDNDELESFGLSVATQLENSISSYDAILIMNNHPDNKFVEKILPTQKKVLIFDGWNILNKSLILGYKNLTFSNLGFFEE